MNGCTENDSALLVLVEVVSDTVCPCKSLCLLFHSPPHATHSVHFIRAILSP